jgi:hypothetical protein
MSSEALAIDALIAELGMLGLLGARRPRPHASEAGVRRSQISSRFALIAGAGAHAPTKSKRDVYN